MIIAEPYKQGSCSSGLGLEASYLPLKKGR
jgi:hypothetical protein